MPITVLEAAEALLPLVVAGVLFGGSARRERRRIALEMARLAVDRTPAAAVRGGALDRIHEARMRRRALRMIARHRSGTAG